MKHWDRKIWISGGGRVNWGLCGSNALYSDIWVVQRWRRLLI